MGNIIMLFIYFQAVSFLCLEWGFLGVPALGKPFFFYAVTVNRLVQLSRVKLAATSGRAFFSAAVSLSLIHISEPTRP